MLRLFSCTRLCIPVTTHACSGPHCCRIGILRFLWNFLQRSGVGVPGCRALLWLRKCQLSLRAHASHRADTLVRKITQASGPMRHPGAAESSFPGYSTSAQGSVPRMGIESCCFWSGSSASIARDGFECELGVNSPLIQCRFE